MFLALIVTAAVVVDAPSEGADDDRLLELETKGQYAGRTKHPNKPLTQSITQAS